MNTQTKWPFYTVSIGSKFSLQRKHAMGLEESLMRSTMDMGTFVNELKFSLRINISSHIACGYKKGSHKACGFTRADQILTRLR